MIEDPIIIIDSHAVGHAAKHSYGGLSYGGEPVGVIYGFLTKMLSLAQKFDTRKFVFTFDSGKSYRRDIYSGYKIKDIEYSEEEIENNRIARYQLGLLRTQVLPELGFSNIYIQTGLEADDIIASCVIHNKGTKIILSDDRDLYQLLGYCDMFKLKKKKLYTKQNLKDRWGCTPEEWKEMKIYAGCKGDKVPNIPGVAEKTALKYLQGRASVKVETKINLFLRENPDFIDRNKSLTWLPFEDTQKIKFKEFNKLQYMDIYRVCNRYGFNSLINKNYNRTWERFC